ncbi:MAG: YhbY family RNA-binding protein [Candidatus Latescibacterota bacterium]|nr:YhbY family RNA-binding protein [Candidatus Latescibacterota bacterium]
MENVELRGKQRRYLRSLGYGLKPSFSVGKAGMSPALLKSVEDAYNKSELIKGRVEQTCALDRKQAAAQVAEATESHLVQVLGRTFLLYRRHSDNPKIQLP